MYSRSYTSACNPELIDNPVSAGVCHAFKTNRQFFPMRQLQRFVSKDGKNTLAKWHKAKNPFVVLRNIIIDEVACYLPLSIKNALYRTIGIKLGKNVAISYKCRMDVFFPELISIDDNTIIGYNTTILSHEFLIGEWRKGAVSIGRNVMIGANCTVLAGVSIGSGSIVSAMTLVNKSIPESSFASGNPMKIKRKRK